MNYMGESQMGMGPGREIKILKIFENMQTDKDDC